MGTATHYGSFTPDSRSPISASHRSTVADDINAIIANFDPRIYFPKLFVSFALKSAANINHLAAYAEYKESAVWHALQELYKVDLEKFVDFDPEAVELGDSHASGG